MPTYDLKSVDVVMACIGSDISTRDMTLIYDTATAITDALKTHQEAKGPAYKPPSVIQLRTGSLDSAYKAKLPYLAQILVPFCFHYVYADLKRAYKHYAAASEASESERLLHRVSVDPPAIHDADGTLPTGYKVVLDGSQSPALSYADLGVAFCEIAERRDEFGGKAVGVTATGHVNMTMDVLAGYMIAGVKARMWGVIY